ncbi:MAG: methyltransferase domain-containing protein [Dehalococcoidia bacterium]
MAEHEPDDLEELRAESRRIWDRNATFWDDYFREGNRFHKHLIEPAVDRLLDVQPDERVLEIGCGNGAHARHTAARGARVLATDFSAVFLERARERTTEHAGRIEYRQVDATDQGQLLGLGEGGFDAAVANMALMDMPVIDPWFRALPRLLRPGGRFVFSVGHPCFHTTGVSKLVEETDRDGEMERTYAIKVTRYLGLGQRKGLGIAGQPEPHYYWDRPLHVLFGAAFRAGLVLDGLEEPSFAPDADRREGNPVAWQNYTEIPPVLVARLRPAPASG